MLQNEFGHECLVEWLLLHWQVSTVPAYLMLCTVRCNAISTSVDASLDGGGFSPPVLSWKKTETVLLHIAKTGILEYWNTDLWVIKRCNQKLWILQKTRKKDHNVTCTHFIPTTERQHRNTQLLGIIYHARIYQHQKEHKHVIIDCDVTGPPCPLTE